MLVNLFGFCLVQDKLLGHFLPRNVGSTFVCSTFVSAPVSPRHDTFLGIRQAVKQNHIEFGFVAMFLNVYLYNVIQGIWSSATVSVFLGGQSYIKYPSCRNVHKDILVHLIYPVVCR